MIVSFNVQNKENRPKQAYEKVRKNEKNTAQKGNKERRLDN